MIREGLDQGEEVNRGLQERMQRLEQMVREIGPFDYVTIELEPPFTYDIMVANYPPRFHLPQMESYDGHRDPTEHLELYRTFMEVQ